MPPLPLPHALPTVVACCTMLLLRLALVVGANSDSPNPSGGESVLNFDETKVLYL